MIQYTGSYTGTFEDDIYHEKSMTILITVESPDIGCACTLLETIGRAYNWELNKVELDGEVVR